VLVEIGIALSVTIPLKYPGPLPFPPPSIAFNVKLLEAFCTSLAFGLFEFILCVYIYYLSI
jgi:hypothetical protein